LQTNHLLGQTSPYLLQHLNNPVDWYPWNANTLSLAKKLNRPILLSIGYAACHWCHVMAHECFEDEAIASFMNEHFVCIKVDREERPDVDQLYMTFTQLLSGQGGWPMTVFLTPSGHPYFAGTYFPPSDNYGRPGFPRVLKAMSDAWLAEPEKVLEIGESLINRIAAVEQKENDENIISSETIMKANKIINTYFDKKHGGFGSSPKFPHPGMLDFLFRHAHSTGDQTILDFALFTMDRMAEGGIYDHLGGGFHRYSTDEFWLVPHFEKMLYDNALLTMTYLDAWKISKSDFYQRVIFETMDYILREMTASEGGFYSSQDADSEGIEGKFYVWTMQEIESILGKEDAAFLSRYYDITPHGNWKHKNILNISTKREVLAKNMGISQDEFDRRLDSMRYKLRSARNLRLPPLKDDKIIMSWNGLAISAFARAGAAFGRQDYLDIAEKTAQLLWDRMSAKDTKILSRQLYRTGRFLHCDTKEKQFVRSNIPGFLEDYASFGLGLFELFCATGNSRWLSFAKEIADAIPARFIANDNGFYSVSSESRDTILHRTIDRDDGATPSGNSLAASLFLKLSILTENPKYKEYTEQILSSGMELLVSQPLSASFLLSTLDLYLHGDSELFIMSANRVSDDEKLWKIAIKGYHPNMLLGKVVGPLPDTGLFPYFSEKNPADIPIAFFCKQKSCSPPVSDPDTLQKLLIES
jgi:uncharacterized protein YyaL (SSP411 family)